MMESVEEKAKERSGLQRFSPNGLTLLPWTKQILTVLWENFCLLIQVICYSLMSVFQMFRFEVHLRITDDAGEHIQQMKDASDEPTDGFLFPTLFKSKKNVAATNPGPLSNFKKDPFDITHSKSVLSSLVSDNLCCSLVEDFMCHGDEEQYGWQHRFDWNFHTSSESSFTDVVSFTECVSIFNVNDNQKQGDHYSGAKPNLSNSKISGQGLDSDLSWGSSDSSSVDSERPDSDRFWDIVNQSNDPYNPLHFKACLSSAVSDQQRNKYTSQTGECSCSDSNEHGKTGTMNLEDEEEALWKSLSWNDDPYHPLNFRAPLKSSSMCIHGQAEGLPASHDQSLKKTKGSTIARRMKPNLTPKRIVSHRCHQLCVEKPSIVPWKRSITKPIKKEFHTIKRVKFSSVIQVHKMQAWSFAFQASRKGPWEEHARDRNRFQKRILETEQAIGYCFSLLHRNKFSAYQLVPLTKQTELLEDC